MFCNTYKIIFTQPRVVEIIYKQSNFVYLILPFLSYPVVSTFQSVIVHLFGLCFEFRPEWRAKISAVFADFLYQKNAAICSGV